MTVSRAWCRWWTSEIERLLSFGPLASGAKCSVLHVRRVTHAIYATPKKIEEMTTALGLITLYSRIRLFMTVLSFSGLLLHFHIIYMTVQNDGRELQVGCWLLWSFSGRNGHGRLCGNRLERRGAMSSGRSSAQLTLVRPCQDIKRTGLCKRPKSQAHCTFGNP